MSENQASRGTDEIVRSTWRDQAVWSETANRFKADLTRWRNSAAVAGVVGAFLATLAAALDDPDGLRAAIALLGAVVLAVVPYVTRTKASKDRVREWVRARSASEALKEEIYRYLVGAPPYPPGAAPASLIARREAVKEKVQELNVHAAGVDPAERERPLALTPDDYVERRVNDQVDHYYLPKGRENARTAKRFHDLEFALGLLAVVLATMAGATATTGWSWLDSLGSWVAVVTTAGAAVTAHLAAARYDHQAMTYFATANRLVGLRDAWQADPDRLDPARVAKFVDDCENAISTENEAWLAEWTREEREGTKGQPAVGMQERTA